MVNDILAQLAAPFRVEYIEWKPGSTTKDNTKCLAMAYADLRAYMERLDEVCGIDWSVEYQPWGDSRIIARLTIAGVTRSSTGESDAQDQKNGLAGTVSEAQAFKRACAMFGLGRSLYDLPSVWVEYDGKKITEKGQTQLNSSYKQWYARIVAKTSQRPATPATGSANPFDDTTPAYVLAFQNLTGKDYDFIKWTKTLHAKSNGPCTEAQYGYLVGIMDKLTNNQHGYALSLLCQSEIGKDNLPGHKVADQLLPLLTPTRQDELGNTVDNPDYRVDMAAMITAFSLMQVAA